MNDLKIFENHQFGEIRVIEQDGEPWFVAAAVCRALGLEQITRAMDRLDDDEGGLVKVTHPQSPTKTMDVNAVNEPGLYHLVLCSNKPEAKAFKRWITHEVIPAIRRTGSYTVPNMSKELRAIFVLDHRTVEHEQRITALEENMVVDYGQQCALKAQVNAVVIQALGGINTPAYSDKNVRSRTYSECNRDIQNWFRVNSRNNIPRKRFDDAVDYIQRWRPSTNMSMLIRQTNEQVQIYK